MSRQQNNIGLVCLFPEMFQALEYGIVGRAIREKIIKLSFFNPKDFSPAPHHQVDDRPYGGGPGMVMTYPPLTDAIDAAKSSLQAPEAHVVHLSPQGKPVDHQDILRLAAMPNLVLVASRYEGIDERILQTHIDEELSIGDIVVSGGELPAMTLVDAITRCLPGALGHAESATQDSFATGLLDHPHYTRPESINGMDVPEVLRNGNHAAISAWRREQSIKKTWQNRPDLIKRCSLNKSEQALIDQLSAPLTPEREESPK